MLNKRWAYAACGALFRKQPVGLKFAGGLEQETAAFLQDVAWETLTASTRTQGDGAELTIRRLRLLRFGVPGNVLGAPSAP